MNTINRGNPGDGATELFGTSTDRETFERAARDRADEPQTAGALVLTTLTIPIIITVSICSAC